jgi:hypothetical protein
VSEHQTIPLSDQAFRTRPAWERLLAGAQLTAPLAQESVELTSREMSQQDVQYYKDVKRTWLKAVSLTFWMMHFKGPKIYQCRPPFSLPLDKGSWGIHGQRNLEAKEVPDDWHNSFDKIDNNRGRRPMNMRHFHFQEKGFKAFTFHKLWNNSTLLHIKVEAWIPMLRWQMRITCRTQYKRLSKLLGDN